MGYKSFLLIFLLVAASAVSLGMAAEEGPSECDTEHKGECYNRAKAMKLKIIAIIVILVASMSGVSLPLFSRLIPALGPEKKLFVVVKAFASGVILSTGFMHVLPDSLDDLQSECLPDSPWHEFPFSTFIAMLSAVGTLMMDSFSMAVHHRRQRGKVDTVEGGESPAVQMAPVVHIHAHGHGHFPTIPAAQGDKDEEVDATLKRNRVIAQVWSSYTNSSSVIQADIRIMTTASLIYGHKLY